MNGLNESVYIAESEDLVLTKIENYFGEHRPDLIINFGLDHQPNDVSLENQYTLIDGLKLGLGYIIKTSNPLIITNGQSRGISKIIGESVSEEFRMAEHFKIKLLAISSLDSEFNNNYDDHLNRSSIGRNSFLTPIGVNSIVQKQLNNAVSDLKDPRFIIVKRSGENSQENFHYKRHFEQSESKILKGKDINHSHFILLDHKMIEKQTITNRLVNRIANLKLNETIPTVLIVINGNATSLLSIINSLENNVPVILIKETNGLADFLAEMLEQFNCKSSTEKDQLLSSKSNDAWFSFCSLFKNSDEYDFLHLKTIFQKTELLDTLWFKTEENLLHFKILKSFSKTTFLTNIPEETLMNLKQKILCLAIKWNLVEETANILDSIIPNLKSSKTNILNLNDLCFNAIQENRPEILQLILLRDPNVLNGSFHPLKLYLLYNFKNKEQDLRKAPFTVIFKRKSQVKGFSFNYIKLKLEELIGVKLNENELFNENIGNFDRKFDPHNVSDLNSNNDYLKLIKAKKIQSYNLQIVSLFIWCILFNRPQIAKVILPKLKNPIAYALVASIIFRKYYMLTNLDMFRKSSEEFEYLAVKISDYFEIKEEEKYKINLLLEFPINEFHISREKMYCTLLQLAYASKCHKFVCSSIVQQTLQVMWFSSDIVSNNNEITQMRKNYEQHKFKSNTFDYKYLISFFTLGLTAPFMHYKENQESTDESQDEIVKSNYETLTMKKKPFSYWQKYKHFMLAPQTMLNYEDFFFLMFLTLFSYWMLYEFSVFKTNDTSANVSNNIRYVQTSPIEYILLVWVFSYLCQTIRQIVIYFQRKIWFSWNNIVVAGCVFFVAGITLKRVSCQNAQNFNMELFKISRLILCIDLVLWYLRVIGFLIRFESIGHKLVMIKKMIKNIVSILVIILVFILAYGITIQAMITYEISSHVLLDALDISYWSLFGQILFFNTASSTNDTYSLYYGYIATGIYMLILLLLTNLLIAAFISSYTKLEQHTKELWMFHRFELIYFQYNLCADYSLLPLPSPFSLIDVLLVLLKFSACWIKNIFVKMFEILKRRKKITTSPETNPEDPTQKKENVNSSPQTSNSVLKECNKNQTKPIFFSTNKLNEAIGHIQLARKLSNYTEVVLNSQYIKQMEIHYSKFSYTLIKDKLERTSKKLEQKLDNVTERLESKINKMNAQSHIDKQISDDSKNNQSDGINLLKILFEQTTKQIINQLEKILQISSTKNQVSKNNSRLELQNKEPNTQLNYGKIMKAQSDETGLFTNEFNRTTEQMNKKLNEIIQILNLKKIQSDEINSLKDELIRSNENMWKFKSEEINSLRNDSIQNMENMKLINLLKNESERTYEKLEKKIDQTTEKLDIIMQMLNSKNSQLEQWTLDLTSKLIDTKLSQMNEQLNSRIDQKNEQFEKKLEQTTEQLEEIIRNISSSNVRLLQSTILTEQQASQLLTLCEFPATQKWKLIYQATIDGFSSDSFHSQCDIHPNTLIIIKSLNGYLFGGYTQASWSGNKIGKIDPKALLFSLINKENRPLIMKCKKEKNAIWCHPLCGPIFGSGYDILICSNSNTTDHNYFSYSNLGGSYEHPEYSLGSNDAKIFLAGSNRFQTSEIEAFTIDFD